jgi:hypothetical protein
VGERSYWIVSEAELDGPKLKAAPGSNWMWVNDDGFWRPDVRRVGRDLGVRYVLEGSVRKAGNRVRIAGQLIDAATGGHIWPTASTATSKTYSSYRTR